MEFTEIVKAAGIVGAGGAGFPTHVKLNTKAECFIVNAAECEPLIETDKYLCRTFPEKIVQAAVITAGHLGAGRIVIALKGKYKAEIDALSGAIAACGAKVELFEMPTFYPAGDEQTMVQMVTGKTVPERGIPIEVGAVVDNVGTLLNLWFALKKGYPVCEKYLSVVGEVKEPVMLHTPIGTRISECIAAAKPTIEDYGIILGGPMMGRVLLEKEAIESAVVTKTTGNIIVLPRDHYLFGRASMSVDTIRHQAQSACTQCRACTDMCPRGLIGHNIRPNMIMRNIWREKTITDEAEYKRCFGEAQNCCDCGVCEMFACPMGLSPRKINVYLKAQLREKGIKMEKTENPTALDCIDIRRTPTERLVSRLGLGKYYSLHAHECLELEPSEVYIPFAQHIGKPAVPAVSEGTRVEKGALLAQAAEGALSANIHASISGTVASADAAGALIRRG